MNFLNKRLLITTITYMLLITLSVLFVLRPLIQRVQDKQSNLATEYVNYKNAQLKLSQLTKLNKEKDAIENAKIISVKAVPQTLEQDRFILTIEQLAKDSNITLGSFTVSETKTNATPASKGSAATTTPAPATPSGQLAKLNATMDISGEYNAVLHFITSAENLERIIAITSTTITPGENGAIKASLLITAFGQSNSL